MMQAALFDFDGVLIDSREAHLESWERLAVTENLTLPQGHFEKGFGRTNEVIIPEILQWATDSEEVGRLAEAKEAVYREILAGGEIALMPGAVSWLDLLAARGIPCAIASSTVRANIEVVLQATGAGHYFQAISSAEDVTRGKPDPEVFLRAASKLGVSPEKCVVFEDALAGIEAALAAGMTAIAVTSSHPAACFKNVNKVVDRLDQLSVDEFFA